MKFNFTFISIIFPLATENFAIDDDYSINLLVPQWISCWPIIPNSENSNSNGECSWAAIDRCNDGFFANYVAVRNKDEMGFSIELSSGGHLGFADGFYLFPKMKNNEFEFGLSLKQLEWKTIVQVENIPINKEKDYINFGIEFIPTNKIENSTIQIWVDSVLVKSVKSKSRDLYIDHGSNYNTIEHLLYTVQNLNQGFDGRVFDKSQCGGFKFSSKGISVTEESLVGNGIRELNFENRATINNYQGIIQIVSIKVKVTFRICHSKFDIKFCFDKSNLSLLHYIIFKISF